MNNQNGASSKSHSPDDQTATEPLLNGKQGGSDPASTGNGNDDTAGLDLGPPSAHAKTVTILDSNENRKKNDPREVARARERYQPMGVATPPDGGWGWVVVFSSFAISMLVDGVCFSFGIFFDEFRKEFGGSKSETSWIGSVLNGTYLAVGPVVSALVNVFGCKKVVTAGAIVAFFGFFISTYSRSLGALIFTYGFLGGFGFGLMYLPAIVMVGYYFERRRALATGIACCGSGIGAFCFAPLCEYLLEEFGWRGATWIISGLVLNGVVFAMFYKPIEMTSPDSSETYNTDSGVSIESEVAPSQGSGVQASTFAEGPSGKALMLSATGSPVDSEPSPGIQRLNKKLHHNKRTRSVSLNESPSQIEDVSRLALSTDFGMMVRKRQANSTGTSSKSTGQRRRFGSEVDMLKLSPLQRKDIFYSGSLMHLKEYQDPTSSLVPYQDRLSRTDKSANHSSIAEFSTTVTMTNSTKMSAAESFSQAFTKVFDFSLLKSPTFLIYGWACFLCMAGFFVPFVYMPTHAIDLGLGSRNAAYLIAIIGITNTVGRVGVGFLSDQPWADCLLINNVALIIGGVATMFVPFYSSYSQLAVYSSVFGLAVAVFVSLRSIIMVELMGLDRLTSAFGLVIMCQGISAFLGAPIAGSLSDTYGNYNAAFYLAGISFALSGISCIPLRRISRWEKERAAKRALQDLDQLSPAAAMTAPSVEIRVDSPKAVDLQASLSLSAKDGGPSKS
ncbi:hypothetical protein EGW08_022064 [Elysia chlorotica]|uniref:Major facilitator superfamily (MFS) profile domain-containing protein n=1 Tax=Elysia chlorotica TaxID=188477 RepID=A0A433SLW7_ELYCH|nr:hypothetical protein EGW08_022064 [Elysia chlorotica]